MGINVNGERYQCSKQHTHLYFPTLQMNFKECPEGLIEVYQEKSSQQSETEKQVEQDYRDQCCLEMRPPDDAELTRLLTNARDISVEKVTAPQEKLTQIYLSYLFWHALNTQVFAEAEHIQTIWKTLYPLLQSNELSPSDTLEGEFYQCVQGHIHFYCPELKRSFEGDQSKLVNLRQSSTAPLSDAQVRVKQLYKERCLKEGRSIDVTERQTILDHTHNVTTTKVRVLKERLTEIKTAGDSYDEKNTQLNIHAKQLETLWRDCKKHVKPAIETPKHASRRATSPLVGSVPEKRIKNEGDQP